MDIEFTICPTYFSQLDQLPNHLLTMMSILILVAGDENNQLLISSSADTTNFSHMWCISPNIHV